MHSSARWRCCFLWIEEHADRAGTWIFYLFLRLLGGSGATTHAHTGINKQWNALCFPLISTHSGMHTHPKKIQINHFHESINTWNDLHFCVNSVKWIHLHTRKPKTSNLLLTFNTATQPVNAETVFLKGTTYSTIAWQQACYRDTWKRMLHII